MIHHLIILIVVAIAIAIASDIVIDIVVSRLSIQIHLPQQNSIPNTRPQIGSTIGTMQKDSKGISIGGFGELIVFGGGDEGFDARQAEIEGAVDGGTLEGVGEVVGLEGGEAQGTFIVGGRIVI